MPFAINVLFLCSRYAIDMQSIRLKLTCYTFNPYAAIQMIPLCYGPAPIAIDAILMCYQCANQMLTMYYIYAITAI